MKTKLPTLTTKYRPDSQGCRLTLVGYPQEPGHGLPYIRLETMAGEYLGSLKKTQVHHLKDWCEKALGEK